MTSVRALRRPVCVPRHNWPVDLARQRRHGLRLRTGVPDVVRELVDGLFVELESGGVDGDVPGSSREPEVIVRVVIVL